MDKSDWLALPRRARVRMLDHMRASTAHAWSLTDDDMERILNGFFEAMDCGPDTPCSACRLGWTKPPIRRAASGEDASNEQAGRARSEESDG